MEELVSIVVPVYNVEAYLDECVQSLVDQTYQNLEIILVDDGSTDQSGYLCDLWVQKDTRIRVIHKANAGAGMARNTGMDEASGKYLFFVDSDDYIDITTVEKCVHSACQNGAEVVLFGRNNVYEDGRIVPLRVKISHEKFMGESIRKMLLPGLFTYEFGLGASSWGRMYNTQLLKQNNLKFLSEREVASEDSCFTLELFSMITSIAVIHECLYFYRNRMNSISRVFQKNRQTISNTFLQQSRQLCERLGYGPEVARHVQARYHMYSLAHMKQIAGSDVPQKEKYVALRSVFHDTFLLQSITDDALQLCNRSSRIFWRLFRKRHFWCCWLLLWYKSGS